MPLGSDLHSAVNDSSAPPAERAPGELPVWDAGHSTQRPVLGAEGRNWSYLSQLHPLQKCQKTAASDGDEKLGTKAIPLPRPTQPPSLEERCSWPCRWLQGGSSLGKWPLEQPTVFTTSSDVVDLDDKRPR